MDIDYALNSRVDNAYSTLEKKGYDVRRTDDSALFHIMADGHTRYDTKGCGKYEVIDFNGTTDFGVYTDVEIVLRDNGLFSEWVNPSLVAVYDRYPEVRHDIVWNKEEENFIKVNKIIGEG